MNDLLSEVLRAHGGLEAWHRLHRFGGHMVAGGGLFDYKGFPNVFADVNFEGQCHDQEISHFPFIRIGQHSVVRPAYTAIVNETDEIVMERNDPRSAYAADPTTHWDGLHLAYFGGYALWNYLTAPFMFKLPGVETEELSPVQEGDETLRRLVVRCPDTVWAHSREQTFYISQTGLIVRMNYAPEVTGGIPAANFASGHREVAGGLIMPTRRSVFRIGTDGSVDRSVVLVSIDIDELAYS